MLLKNEEVKGESRLKEKKMEINTNSGESNQKKIR